MNVLVDTCFWYAYYDPRDAKHEVASRLMGYLEGLNIVVPYPTLYETMNTRFAKRKDWMAEFQALLSNNSCQVIADEPYKENALSLAFSHSLHQDRPLSLVDMVLRLMISDVNLKIDAVISFNAEDFIDICIQKNIELITE